MKDAATVIGYLGVVGGVASYDWRASLIVGGGLLLIAVVWGHVR